MTNILKMSFAILLCISVVSCKDEKKDDSNPTQQEMISGHWKMEKFEHNGETTNDNDSVVNTYSFYGSDFTGNISFNSNGSYNSNLEFTITKGGNNTTYSSKTNLKYGTGTWELDANDNLIFDKHSNPWSPEVISLSESKLVLKALHENPTILTTGDTATKRIVTVLSFQK